MTVGHDYTPLNTHNKHPSISKNGGNLEAWGPAPFLLFHRPLDFTEKKEISLTKNRHSFCEVVDSVQTIGEQIWDPNLSNQKFIQKNPWCQDLPPSDARLASCDPLPSEVAEIWNRSSTRARPCFRWKHQVEVVRWFLRHVWGWTFEVNVHDGVFSSLFLKFIYSTLSSVFPCFFFGWMRKPTHLW